jgi:hypothetical protein
MPRNYNISSERISRNTGRGIESRRAWTYHRLSHTQALDTSEDLRNSRKLSLLPTSAREFYKEEIKSGRKSLVEWNPVTRTVLTGIRSATSSLSLLQDHETTLGRAIISMIPHPHLDNVRLTIPAGLVGNGYGSRMRFTHGRERGNDFRRELFRDTKTESNAQNDGYVAFSRCGVVEFPAPTSRKVNMMPFILGDKQSLPDDLQSYWGMIEACPYVQEEVGKIAYLTVHESYVDTNKSQRRGGLHIESPGFFADDVHAESFHPGVEHPWGMGVFFSPDKYEGGIYIASNRSDTTEVWDALVDSSVPGMVDKGGGCEYLREWIGTGTKLQANELIWMTDRTPHEALPQQSSGNRQFFRLVMPSVSHWFAKHSTANPKVPLPDHVKVIEGDKFERYGITSVSYPKSKK